MWKYFNKELNQEFLLSLDLIVNPKLSNKKIINILYAISNKPEKYYHKKYILKKDGTKRELLVPNHNLKKIQQNILHNCLYGIKPSKYVTSYLKDKSLVNNALPHLSQKIILKLDIKNFFNSIDFESLYRVLPNEVFPPSIKVLLLKLCTYEDYLPQGAPTSPYLSNLVLKNFDNYIGQYCEKNNINYSRYCDDLTFSGDFNVSKMITKVKGFLEEMGYNLNLKKTRVLKSYQSQIVTGIVVNKKLNVPRSYSKNIRQEMYYLKKYGKDHIKRKNMSSSKYLNSLKGKINYCLSINPNNKEMLAYQKELAKINI